MDINIYEQIKRLVNYALNKDFIQKEDIIYTTNQLLEVLKLDYYQDTNVSEEELDSPTLILEKILDWASQNNLLEENTITYRDLLDAKIMNVLMPKPSQITSKFNALYNIDPKEATEYYYNLSKASDYIRTERIKKDLAWKVNTPYGPIDITINLSKPEKDPKAIAKALTMVSNDYPKCLLCVENEGYAGRVNHPARNNHRIIPLNICDEEWYLQYSPYVYYNEHCIVIKKEHEPMKVSKITFDRLLDFVAKFPHYFIGSNADLPIVGGSILSHNHFQGGNYVFAMAKARVLESFFVQDYKEVEICILKWPMSVIRLKSTDKEKLSQFAEIIYKKWQNYSDEASGILAYSNGVVHNTVTPIARINNGIFELDLVLRNNRTSEEHPDGIFHPHKELHHIKKENIGLIEVMGLAVLPARLKVELELLKEVLISKDIDRLKLPELEKHTRWYYEICDKYDKINADNVDKILQEEVGLKFMKVLEHCGVFKDISSFKRFIVTDHEIR